ncbi:hypothetical protein LFYK43_15640 [Ligilactobacillus salitolerans]|uniref:Uncharacterized protein n=1 Tax=Ligilactobacillus salitolerans TaxID=1808352 RepID=A0A401IUB9_9LACO|nr:hypothetical protein [Ligilactobacillus salitolerans]GBG95105.1 hypothetical protein LFYK43_15640 [Ligilactobacillus salitolerans]
MNKNFLLGFSIGFSAVAAGYLYWKRLSAEQRDQLAVKIDDKLANGRDKAAALEEKAAAVAGPKAETALSTLKDSTSKLKQQLTSARDNLTDEPEKMQDDIVIDHRSAFSKVISNVQTDDERPTEKFYPLSN